MTQQPKGKPSKGKQAAIETARHVALFALYILAALALDAWIFGPPYNY